MTNREDTMKIQNTSGNFWTGNCWGVVQNAMECANLEDVPLWIIDGEDEDLTLDVHADNCVRYYRGDSRDAEASVVA